MSTEQISSAGSPEFKSLESMGEAPASSGKIRSLINKIKGSVKNRFSSNASSFTKVASGADKVVWVRKNAFSASDGESAKAFYTPKKTFLFSREKELKAEVEIYDKIQRRIDDIHGEKDDFTCRLAIKHEKLEGKDRIKGKYTIQVDKAISDLENAIKKIDDDGKPMLGVADRLNLDLNQREGIAQLHEIGMISGDAKLDNVLVYPEIENQDDPEAKSKFHAKISDFGRALECDGTTQLVNKGNTRTVDPSGKVSQKGDVWAAAINTIRILEESLVKEKGDKPEIVSVDKKDRDSKAHESRRGVDKFILEHKAFSALENKGTGIGRLKNAGRRLMNKKPSDELKQTRQDLMRVYTRELMQRLVNEGKISGNQGEKLCEMLEQSFDVDPSKRPTAQETVEVLRAVIAMPLPDVEH